MSPIWEGHAPIDQVLHDDARTFATIDLALNQSGETTWAVFNRDYGGNCCEHYLATTTAGAITSAASIRSTQWTAVTTGTRDPRGCSDAQCRTFVPTNPGTKGWVKAPSCRRPTATSSRCPGPLRRWRFEAGQALRHPLRRFGNVVALVLQPYHRTFYDRSWQVEVIDPSMHARQR